MTSFYHAGAQRSRQGRCEVSLTPLDSLEYCRLELFWETRMHRPRLKLLTFQCLEVVKTAFASDLALELFQAVE
jgi:hypothetical protein